MNREILSARLFHAPRETLWEAFADPARLAQWWGPAEFTNEFHEFDFRPGGSWRLTMRAPDSAAYSMKKVFVEIVARERIVHDHIDPVHGFRMSVYFRDISGNTELTWRMLFDSAEEAERVRSFILQANEQNFDRLADYLSRAGK